MRALPVSVGISAAIGGPDKSFLEAISENPMHVEAMQAAIEMKKAKSGG